MRIGMLLRISVIQPVKALKLFQIGDLMFRHESYHLTPGHLAHGSLLDDFSVLLLTEHTGQKTDRIRQISGHTKAVFLGGQIYDAVALRKKVPCNTLVPIAIKVFRLICKTIKKR